MDWIEAASRVVVYLVAGGLVLLAMRMVAAEEAARGGDRGRR